MKFIAGLSVLLSIIGVVVRSQDVTFRLVHINDMHARVQGMKGTGGCQTSENENAECDGGWGRLLTAAKELVASSPGPTIFVDNGDDFTGTAWSSFYQGVEVYTFLNKFCEDAGFVACFSGIGNHEFDFGYLALLNFARSLEHDIINSNVVDTCEANSQVVEGESGTHATAELGSLLKKSKVLDVEGTKVGFVGYVTTDTPETSSPPGCLAFLDEATVLNAEIAELQLQGVDIIIVIGHSGIQKDLELAQSVSGIDIIIGGHSHTFLWDETEMGPIPVHSNPVRDNSGAITGTNSDALASSDDLYPKFPANDQVPVLQAYTGSRYLGAIDLTFNASGILTALERKAVILTNSASEVVPDGTGFAEDTDMMEVVDQLLEPLEQFILTPVGIAAVTLDINAEGTRRIRHMEMPLGNFVCDAMLANINSKTDGQADICFQNGGGIRAPLSKGTLNFGQIVDVHPFSNVLSVMKFTGSRVYAAMEKSLSDVGNGRFLHIGKGMQVFYDPSLPLNNRVVNITLNGTEIPNDESEEYFVVTNSFLAVGGDGYGSIFSDAEVVLLLGDPQEDALADFVKDNCPSCAEEEGRIIALSNPFDSAEGAEVDVIGLKQLFQTCENLDITTCDLTTKSPTAAPTGAGSSTQINVIAAVIAIAASILTLKGTF